MIQSPKKSCLEEATKLLVYTVQGYWPFPEVKVSNDIEQSIPRGELGGGSLVYRVSSRTAQATQRNPVLKTKK